MTAGEFHGHVMKIAKRCQFPCTKAEEKGIRDAIFLDMNSTHARDKAINLMNEEGKEVTVDFLLKHLEVEDCNAHHKSLSQLDSTNAVNMVAYDCRQNRGKSNKSKRASGKNRDSQTAKIFDSSNSTHHSRKPPGKEDKCMRCGKKEHQPGQRCPVKNAKCKSYHKIGHFQCACQSKRKGKPRTNLIQTQEDDDDTHINENGHKQPNPPRVNMLKTVNHIEANRGKFSQGKHLKFLWQATLRAPTATTWL